ncbi:MAG: UDP-3-O-[3-hydroxymyristoyl] N-acetylglucosamine deacetylase [Chlorobi bacterium]|nr:UDP-3-O-[3-hydroxymyristoyl] N-acetylglucosamine deacetylase [Chlorobiota bacterium]
MSDKQKTILNDVKLTGTGLHTGKDVIITFRPAKEDTGYVFRRVDLPGKPEIQAVAENVVETSRSTVLYQNNASVATVEHVMSAIYGLGIDNLIIEIDGPETPILDGSSKYYVDSLLKAGITEQNTDRKYFEIKKTVIFENKETGTLIKAVPFDGIEYEVVIDYHSTVLGRQKAVLKSFDDYAKEIAPCKTFVFLKELEILLKNNQIKGGDLSNALVIVEKEFTQKEFDRIADLFNKKHQKYNGRGVLNEEYMTFENEPARHKLLDLIGDTALSGMRLKAKIIAEKPGHFANTEFVKLLRKEITK